MAASSVASASAFGSSAFGLGRVAEGLVRGLPRPPSLVFDIEIAENSFQSFQGTPDDFEAGTAELKRWLLPSSTGEHKLRNDVKQSLCLVPEDTQSALEANQTLAACLTRLGYGVRIRTALGGGDGFECLRNLRHVFLAVSPPGGMSQATTNRFVVDLSFKEQFRIAKPTNRYQALLACLPEIFVAPEAAVAPLVNFLCQEMAFSFKATDTVLPPWRQTNSMLSKWLPRMSLDEQVSGNSSFATGVPHQQQSQSTGTLAPRRSMDAASAMNQAAHGHWMQPALYQTHKIPAAYTVQQQALQQRNKFQQGEGATGTTDAALGCNRRLGLVKPIVCEPKVKFVGGNFSSIGFS